MNKILTWFRVCIIDYADTLARIESNKALFERYSYINKDRINFAKALVKSVSKLKEVEEYNTHLIKQSERAVTIIIFLLVVTVVIGVLLFTA